MGRKVLACDDSAGAVAGHVHQVDAILAGHEAHGRCSQWTRRGRRCRWWCRWWQWRGGGSLPVPAPVAASAARGRLRRAVADEHRHLFLGFTPSCRRCGSRFVAGASASASAGASGDGDERGTDAHRLPCRGQQLDDRAGEGAGQFDDGLLGFHLDEDLVQGHLVADGHVPRHELGVGEPFTEVGQYEVPGCVHGGRQRSTSCRIRSASGTKWCSTREGGYGVAKPPTRRTGASRWKKQRSEMRAAISAPRPPNTLASWATTSRPVLRTEASIVSKSTGESERRSMTSMDVPSSWAMRAAWSAVATMGP